MLLAIATLALVVSLTSVLLGRGPLGSGPVAALAVVLTAGLWLALNEPVEGPTLVGITSAHGIHCADAALGIVVSLVLSVRLGAILAGHGR